MPAWNLRDHFRHRWVLLLLAAGSIVIASLFAMVGSDVHEGELAGVDRAVRELALEHRAPTAVTLFNIVSWLGGKSILILLAMAAGWVVSGRSKTLVLLIALAGFVSSEFVDLLKAGFSVVRPETGLAERESFSFPSGHVSGTTAIAVLLSYVALRRRKARAPVLLTCAIISLLMGMSRIYLDMHWASDVLGGYLIGAMIGLGFSALYEWIHGRTSRAAG